MPDIDPITREALRRATQMQKNMPRNGSPNGRTPPAQNSASKPEPGEAPREKPDESVHTGAKQSHPIPPEPVSPPEASLPSAGSGLNMLFKDKEQSLILLLIILLMGEDCDPSLLLALMYLLI